MTNDTQNTEGELDWLCLADDDRNDAVPHQSTIEPSGAVVTTLGAAVDFAEKGTPSPHSYRPP
jgi:hypothetical protein